MKRTRLEGFGASHYHVTSRIIEKRFYLGDTEKNVFRDMMWRAAQFSGVQILTYCVMSNHFHILIEVPERVEISDEELVCRLKVLYKGNDLIEVLDEWDQWGGNASVLNEIKERYCRRMYDLSEFMKTLKQRFSFWYNKSHERGGPLWEGRFRSVLVESPAVNGNDFAHNAIETMASYIDLNPVRAGLVDDPKNYCWCGYGEAVSGAYRARKGLLLVLHAPEMEHRSWALVLFAYRKQLCLELGGSSLSVEEIQGVLTRGGELSRRELLRCKVRYFSDGFILGSQAFVDALFERKKVYFGEKRMIGAKKMRGGDWSGLCVARDLKKAVITR